MNRSVLKKIIFSIFICIVLIIIIIISLISLNKQNNSEEQTDQNLVMYSEDSEEEVIVFEDQVDRYDFLIVSNCISDYLDKINKDSASYYGYDENGNYAITLSEDIIKQNICDILSTSYIEKNEITLDNVYDFVEDIQEQYIFIPIDMMVQKGDSVNAYAVYGYIIDLDYNFVENIYTIVNIDTQNETYSIEPIDETYYDSSVLENTIEEIDENDNNQINSFELTELYRLQQYFLNYKFMVLSNPDIAYEFLNEEYREKCFGNVDNFKAYVEENRDKILSTALSEYDSSEVDGYTEFIEKDKNEEYYIFNISDTDATDYNVMLDTYIVGSAEFQDTYNQADNEQKININTMRFINAINDKKYYYAYYILSDSFKDSNFPTLEEFEEYVTNNLFDNNTIEDATLTEDGNYYIYELVISNDNGETKNMTIIMQLLEGTDFVMSFSVE